MLNPRSSGVCEAGAVGNQAVALGPILIQVHCRTAHNHHELCGQCNDQFILILIRVKCRTTHNTSYVSSATLSEINQIISSQPRGKATWAVRHSFELIKEREPTWCA